MFARRRLIEHVRKPRRQWRVLYLMCLSLVVVVLAMPIAARPRTWDWLFRFGQKAPATGKSELLPRARISVAGLDRAHDRTPGIVEPEAAVFDELVEVASRSEVQGSGDVPFDELLQNPARYRGCAIELSGTVRRLERCTNRLVPNADGPLHEAWLFTDESGVRPYRIVTQRMPTGAAEGLRVEIPARVRGFFFKVSSYDSPAGPNFAPLLVAGRLEFLSR